MRADPWWHRVGDLDGLEVAEALGLTPAWGRGRASRWRLPHGDCPGQQGDGEPSVFYGSEARRLCCRKCSKTLGNLDVIAAYLGIAEAVCDAVQLEASAHGWCEPPPRVDQQALDQRRAEARARMAQVAEQRARREAQRRAEAIDVHAEWAKVAGQGVDALRAWSQEARGWPRSLAEAIPLPDCGIAPECGTAGRLGALACYWRRRLLIAIRDGRGEVVSASCRYHLPGAPTDGGPKALTLPADRTVAGPLTGRPHAFGDLALALDLAARGHVLVLAEGGPDYLAAAALARLHGQAVALGACSAQLMPTLGQHIRAQLRVRIGDSGRRPRIVLAPHRDAAGEAGAREAEAILAQVGEVRVAQWPEGCDDLGDVAKRLPLATTMTTLFGKMPK